MISAGRLLGEPAYVDAGRYVQAYYTAQTDLAAFNRLYPAPPILALAIVGPIANVIDLYRTGRSSPL